MVRTFQGAAEGDVFLDRHCPQCRRRDRRGMAGGVVGQADLAAGRRFQRGDGGQVEIVPAGRIAGGAMKDGDVGTAGMLERGDRLFDFVEIGRARGQQDRFSGRAEALQQRREGHVTGRHLVAADPDILHQVDRGEGEGCGHEFHAIVGGAGLQRGMPVIGEAGIAEGRVFRVLHHLTVSIANEAGDQPVPGQGLEFDGIGAGAGGSLDIAFRLIQVAAMIGADLGDEIDMGHFQEARSVMIERRTAYSSIRRQICSVSTGQPRAMSSAWTERTTSRSSGVSTDRSISG